MRAIHYVSSEILSLSTVKDIIDSNKKIGLSEEAVLNIKKSHEYLQKKLKKSDEPIYGINTGFGSLYNVRSRQIISLNYRKTS